MPEDRDTINDPEQIETALDQVFRLLCLSVEAPGSIPQDELGSWLRMAADERDRQGDFGAARMLDALAAQADDE